jgi:N-acetylglutamate synthase-like GNAT family acetyltransferase
MSPPPDDGIEIRPAQAADVEALGRFIEPFVAQGKLLPRTHDELTELVRTGFVAVKQDRIIGFAALEVYSPKFAELRSLAVEPGEQGRGVGRQLVAACLELAERRRIFEVMAITSTDEFFRRCGFDFTLPGEKKALFLQTRDCY